MEKKQNLIVVGVSRSGIHFILEQLESWNLPYNIYKFENAATEKKFKEKIKSHNIDMSLQTKILVIKRDYLNWLASITKYVYEREIVDNKIERISEYIKHWKDLFNNRYGIDDKVQVVVDYNIFFKSRAIRKELCRMFGGKYTEKKLDHIPNAGGGSSFAISKHKDGLPGGISMPINTRKIQILKTPYKDVYLEALASDKEALELHLKLF